MTFGLRLFLTFLLAPPLGALVANIPSSMLFYSLATDGNLLGSSVSLVYMFLVLAVLVFAYPIMLLGIFFVSLYARRKYKWYRYALVGVFLSVLAAFPLIDGIKGADEEWLLAGVLFTVIANGACIATASYFLMGRTDQVPERVE